jgi:hypothetical protein
MENMKKLILIAVLISFTFSCEDFDGWNIDKKHPGEVSGSYLVTNAQKVLARSMVDSDVNSTIFKMFAQHWTETTYTDEANYDLVNRNVGGNFWSILYRSVLANLEDAKRIIADDASLDATTKANQLAVIELMQAYTWHVLVDTFGDIPYTEALVGIDNLVPAYDDDAAIYSSLFSKIDIALQQLSGGGNSFGGADLFYHGNVGQWKKFGNSLKLRMAVRLSDIDNGTASAKASEAVNAGVFTSSTDNIAFPFEGSPPNTNPLWEALVESGRKDYVLANTMVDVMNDLNDPRRYVYMDENLGDDTFVGGPYGANNSYNLHTHIGAIFHTEAFEGLLMSYSEVEFLLAEASARGLIGEDAEAHYNAAVTANFAYWGVDGAADYLDQDAVAYDSENWKKSIGTQKWLSLYARGFEAWASWKLLDYPNTMNRPYFSELPVPRRYIYPNGENDVNGANYEAASSAMGGDNLDSRVFWDVTGAGN